MSSSAQSKATILLSLGIFLPSLLRASSAQEPPRSTRSAPLARDSRTGAATPCRAISRPPTASSTRARSR